MQNLGKSMVSWKIAPFLTRLSLLFTLVPLKSNQKEILETPNTIPTCS